MSGSNSSALSAVAEPVSFAVHSLPDPATVAQRTRAGRIRMLLVWLVCALPVVASYFTYYVVRPQGRANYGTLIDPQRPLPAAAALPLATLDGRAVEPASLRGQWLFVVVADGRCDARCEQMLYTQRQLHTMLGKDRARMDRVWLATGSAPRAELLPALRDTQVLRADRQAVAAWLQPQPGQVLEAHLYLVDPIGNWMMRFPPQAEPKKVRRDLDRLMRAASSWDRDGRGSP